VSLIGRATLKERGVGAHASDQASGATPIVRAQSICLRIFLCQNNSEVIMMRMMMMMIMMIMRIMRIMRMMMMMVMMVVVVAINVIILMMMMMMR
jgi:hypothetical protein